jgi:hypothetical protein
VAEAALPVREAEEEGHLDPAEVALHDPDDPSVHHVHELLLYSLGFY